MKKVYLLIGGNEGNRLELIKEACEQLGTSFGASICYSSIYETQPWGFTAKQNFLNMAAQIKTDQTPHEILNRCLSIEKNLGRERLDNTYISRTMDIDILFYENEIVDFPDLKIPHPLISERRFVLTPLAEIAPNFIHPIFKKSIAQLLNECTDLCEARKIHLPFFKQ